MQCLNCGKDMAKNFKVIRMPSIGCISYEGIDPSVSYRCWKCGTIQVDNVWYLPEESVPSTAQEEMVHKMYDVLRYPIPFPSKQNFQRYINRNEGAYHTALKKKTVEE